MYFQTAITANQIGHLHASSYKRGFCSLKYTSLDEVDIQENSSPDGEKSSYNYNVEVTATIIGYIFGDSFNTSRIT